MQDPDAPVKKLLWPILDQVVEQVQAVIEPQVTTWRSRGFYCVKPWRSKQS